MIFAVRTGLSLGLLSFVAVAAAPLTNDRYTLELTPGHELRLTARDAGTWTFRPEFVVLRADRDPKPALRPGNIGRAPYNVLTWQLPTPAPGDATVRPGPRNAATAGDGFDDRILKGDTQQRTADVFRAAPLARLVATRVEQRGAEIVLSFAEQPGFRLGASVTLPPGNATPVLAFDLAARQPGYYSVGFTGAPAFPLTALAEIWQPFIWQGKRFPDASYVTPAFECSVPAALITQAGATLGVVADSAEFPFQPLPLLDNSRFGVALRNAAGEAQPMVFAPLLGGPESRLAPGQTFAFKLRLVAAPGRTTDAYETIARELYGFRDYRRNAIGSLNETLDRMIAYGLSDYSHFIDELKGCAYSTDVPGAVKNVSALNPLELALVTDDEEIFKKRAYPIVEFLLSREKFLFSLDPAQKIQSPSRALKGPCAPVSELAALSAITRGASPVFLRLAEDLFTKNRVLNLEDVSEGASWQNAFALYEATHEARYLARARRGADDYIRDRVERSPVNFDEGGLFFWTAYAPKWIDLLRLHEATGERLYLEAARQGARDYAQFVWMCPAIPDASILVNPGGRAPIYWYLKSKGAKPMLSPEERVPAWRLSEIGLTPESSGTMSGHRGIFMANYAAWMLRVAALTGDAFLHDIARSAIVGRYTNFPGYHINTARTTIYEKPDYPLHAHDELSVNSFHYNHVWPHLSLLLDFLVSDIAARSGGQIDFPARFIEAYAYLQSNFYGDRAGKFYGHDDATLWLPRHLLTSGSVELNYLAARGDGRLYLAFANQSPEPVTTEIVLDATVVPGIANQSYQLGMIADGHRAPGGVMRDGRFTVSVSPMGLTAVVVEGLAVVPKFQQRLLAAAPAQAWARDYAQIAYGGARAMILNFGPAAKTAYVYLQADDRKFKEVSLTYDFGAEKRTLTDAAYPFEFTVPLPEGATEFTFQLKGVTSDGRMPGSETITLHR